MNLSRNSGYLLLATGVIHNLLGFIMGKDVVVQILNSGVINSINTEMDRNAIFWFLFSGFMMMILGKLMQDYIKHLNKALPVSLGF
jgi:Na+/proline symporter